MKLTHYSRLILFAILVVAVSVAAAAEQAERYSYVENPHPDATGKVYMGRNIAHVMGHQDRWQVPRRGPLIRRSHPRHVSSGCRTAGEPGAKQAGPFVQV